MSLADAIPLRLRRDKRELYESQALAAELPLSTYLRQRLEKEDAVLDELQMLRRAVERVAERATNAPNAAPGGFDQTSVLLEILLTMRQMGSGKSEVAQRELERQGIKIWSSDI